MISRKDQVYDPFTEVIVEHDARGNKKTALAKYEGNPLIRQWNDGQFEEINQRLAGYVPIALGENIKVDSLIVETPFRTVPYRRQMLCSENTYASVTTLPYIRELWYRYAVALVYHDMNFHFWQPIGMFFDTCAPVGGMRALKTKTPMNSLSPDSDRFLYIITKGPGTHRTLQNESDLSVAWQVFYILWALAEGNLEIEGGIKKEYFHLTDVDPYARDYFLRWGVATTVPIETEVRFDAFYALKKRTQRTLQMNDDFITIGTWFPDTPLVNLTDGELNNVDKIKTILWPTFNRAMELGEGLVQLDYEALSSILNPLNDE